MAAGLRNKGYLDPEKCWKYWNIEEGSLGLVQNRLLQEGFVNEETGNPPTTSAIQKSAFQWAIKNQAEARKDLEYAWERKGHILTNESWRKFLFKAGRLLFYQSPNKFEKFKTENGFEGTV